MPDQDASIGFDELKQRHAAMAAQLPSLHRQIGDCIVRTEHSKGPFHELPLYSYQRDRMKRGKPIAQPGRIRNTSEVHVYHFDAGDRIVRVDVGNGLQQFQSHYVVQHPLGFFIDRYAHDENPLSTSFYRVQNGVLTGSRLHGKYGGLEESYFYHGAGDAQARRLASVRVRSFSHDDAGHASTNTEHFTHDTAGVLRKIELHYELGEREVIYQA